MRRLRDLWIGLHPELNRFTAQNLRDRVSYLKRSNKVPQMLLSSNLTRQDSREDPREDSCVCNDVTADVSMTVADLFQPDDLPRLFDAVQPQDRMDVIDNVVYGPLTYLQHCIYLRYKSVAQNGQLSLSFFFVIDEAVSIILSREKIHNLWELDDLVYSAASIGVERCRKRDSRKAQINVIEQISNQISDSRKLLSRLTEEIRRQHLNRCLTKKLRYNRRLSIDSHSCSMKKLTKERERLLAKLRALTAKRRNAKDQLKWKTENSLFRDNPRQLFRMWRNNTSSLGSDYQLPSIDVFREYWQPLYEQSVSYNTSASWLSPFRDLFSEVTPTDCQTVVTVLRLQMVLKSMKQRSSPGPDAIIVFWWRNLTSTHLFSQFISKLIYDDGADIPSWLPIGKTYLIPKSSDVMNVRK